MGGADPLEQDDRADEPEHDDPALDGDLDPEGDSLEPFVPDATVGPGDDGTAEVLRRGGIEVLGLMPWSSNGTYLVQVDDGTDRTPAIYKPERGERPLWDFPCGLWRREVAAYELSRALGFDLVPTTVERRDAPMGQGSLQAFVPARFSEHYFTLRESSEHHPALRRLCAFDLVANSADRKGGHCLVDADGRIWAIDNGLTFHEEPKLRTVIWDYAGEVIPGDVVEALRRLLDQPLPEVLAGYLTPSERDALRTRAAALLGSGRFPHDPTGRRYPWPLV